MLPAKKNGQTLMAYARAASLSPKQIVNCSIIGRNRPLQTDSNETFILRFFVSHHYIPVCPATRPAEQPSDAPPCAKMGSGNALVKITELPQTLTQVIFIHEIQKQYPICHPNIPSKITPSVIRLAAVIRRVPCASLSTTTPRTAPNTVPTSRMGASCASGNT